MIMADIKKSIVRISNNNGDIIGVGFLVSEKYVLTCAHVLLEAGISEENKSIRIDFPNLQSISPFNGRIYVIDIVNDISIIQIGGIRDKNQVPLGRADGATGHRFISFGYQNEMNIIAGQGEIIDRNINRKTSDLQLRSNEVTKGFSGSPVYDESTKRIVGMIVNVARTDQLQRHSKTAFAISSEKLVNLYPILRLVDICPYRSLNSFTENDVSFFFGREKIVNDIIEKLKIESHFLAVLGPSGCGKSSVIQAGLIPELRKGILHGSNKWGYITVELDYQPYKSLANAGMTNPEKGLKEAVSFWLKKHPDQTRLVIILDKFEKFLVSAPDTLRHKFIDDLSNLLASNSQISLLIILRDDFYSLFHSKAFKLTKWLDRNNINIPKFVDEEELKAIVCKPAHTVGINLEEGLFEVILDEARKADHTEHKIPCTILPLLEFTLTYLWDLRQDGMFTHSAYRRIGGLMGSLTQWFDDTCSRLKSEDQHRAKHILTGLVRLGDVDKKIPDISRGRLLSDFINVKDDTKAIKNIVNYLIDNRLIVTKAEKGPKTIELIHDSIVWEWKQLRLWLRQEREFLLWRQSLETNIYLWTKSASKKNNRDKNQLLKGYHLSIANNWLKQRSKDLNYDEQEYINESIKYERKNKRWKIAFISGSLLFLSIFLCILLYQTHVARIESQNSLSRLLIVKALALPVDNVQSTYTIRLMSLLSVEAAKLLPGIEANNTLRKILDYTAMPMRTISRENLITDLSISNNDKWLAVADGNITRVYDMATGIEKFNIPFNDVIYSVNFSPNSNYIVSASEDGSSRVIDVNSGNEVSRINFSGWIGRSFFSSDGRWIISWGDEITIIWDPYTGSEISKVIHNSIVAAAVLSNNKQIAISIADDGELIAWNPVNNSIYSHFNLGSNSVIRQSSIGLTPDDRYLVIAGNGVDIWDTSTWKKIYSLSISSGLISMSPVNNWVAIAGEDGNGYVWDVSTLTEISTFKQEYTFTMLRFSHDGQFIASACDCGYVRVWNASTGAEYNFISYNMATDIIDAEFSADNSKIITADYYPINGIKVWNISVGGGEIYSVPFGKYILDVSFSPNEKYFIASGFDYGTDSDGCITGTTRFWKTNTGEEVLLKELDTDYSDFYFSSDSKFVVLSTSGLFSQSSSCNKAIHVVDIEEQKEINQFTYEGYLTSTSLSTDNKKLFADYCESDGTNNCLNHSMTIWDVSSGDIILDYEIKEDLDAIAIDHKLNSLITVRCEESDGEQCTYEYKNVQDKNQVPIYQLIQKGQSQILEIDPEDNQAFISSCVESDDYGSCSKSSALLWDLISGKTKYQFELENGIYKVQFSNNSEKLIYGTIEYINIIDINLGKITTIFEGYSNKFSMSFDEKMITIIDSNSVKVIDISSSTLVSQIKNLGESGPSVFPLLINDVAFSPSGKYIISGGEDKTVHVWLWKTEDLISEVCRRINANFYSYEWKLYLGNGQKYRQTCDNLPFPPVDQEGLYIPTINVDN
jgi:WD40 repeat protein